MSAHISARDNLPPHHSRFPNWKKSSDEQEFNRPKIKDRHDDIRSAGNLAMQRSRQISDVPSSFNINPPNDAHEQDAERIAEQILSPSEETERQDLKRAPWIEGQPNSNMPAEAGSLARGLGSGRPLDPASRAFFEQRLGADLSDVRVHTDLEAAASAEEFDAEAYTTGSHIVFGADRYRPATLDGRRLLGHELAHTIQQSAGSPHSKGSLPVRTFTGGPAVMQRQPTPDVVDMHADPMAFIEQQLRRRFTYPEDPRLVVRVRRLQDAFSLLGIREASELLGRLRRPGDELAKNFQKLATASRNRLRAILVGSLPANIEGRVLGDLSLAATPNEWKPLIAMFEVTPSTTEAEFFEGYYSLDEAKAVAVRRPTISAIVRDKKMNRYRVFETGVQTVRGGQGYRLSVRQAASDYELAGWENLEGRELPSPQDMTARMIKAKEMRDIYQKTYGFSYVNPFNFGGTVDPMKEASRKALEGAYLALYEELLPFAQGEFHFSLQFETPVKQGQPQERFVTADPNLININITDIWVHGRQGLVESMDDPRYPGAHRPASMKDALEESSPLYETYITLTPSSLSDDPVETTSVLVHEETHREHAQRSLRLIERWKAEGSTQPFKDWLKDEVTNRRISWIDATLAIEAVEKTSWAFNSELLAEVAGFMNAFHAVPVSKDWPLQRLGQMADMWLNADSRIQELGLRKLQHYYWRILDQPHRNAFDQYVTERWQEAEQSSNSAFQERAAFYLRLLEFYAMK